MSQRTLLAGIAIGLIIVGAAYIWSQRVPPERALADRPVTKSEESAKETSSSPTADAVATTSDDAATSPGGVASSDPSVTSVTEQEPAAQPAENLPDAVPETPVVKAPPPKPLFEGWANPAASFILSGEMHGYVEPCGCSLNQLGGLARRADLFRQIKERGWPVTAFDTGGLVSNAGRRQAKVKMRMALNALHELQYAGIAMGVEEVQIGIDLLQFSENERPPFLSCNLAIGGADLGTHVAWTTTTVGKLKIGVTAVFANSLAPKVVPQNGGQGGQGLEVEVLDAGASLKTTLAELEAGKPDLLVLLAHGRLAESKELARQFPQFHMIVSAGGPEDPDPQPLFVGETLIVAPGQKGKHVAVVAYYPDESGRKFRYEPIALDGERFQETPSMREHMRRYQEALAVQELVSGETRIEDPRNTARMIDDNPFIGAKVCGECHPKAYKKWLNTDHAKATQSIKSGRHGEEANFISRIHDPECVACHATGWDTGRDDPKDYHAYKTGFVSEQATPHLTGQGCENCHGPGGRHTDLERQFQKDGKETDELRKFRDFVHLQLDGIGTKLCVRCHDGDNDPDFKADGDGFEIHWKQIAHPWLD